MSRQSFDPGAANGGAGLSPYDFSNQIDTQFTEIYTDLGDGSTLATQLTSIAALGTDGFLRNSSGTFATLSFADSAEIEWTNADGVAGQPSAALATTGVSAGTYTLPSVTVDAKGRITSISSGTTTSGGEANTASNLAGDEGLFAAKVSADLTFKSLTAGSGISLASDANTVTISAAAGSVAASSVTFTPAGDIAATDVQAAIVELDSEKAATGHVHAASAVTFTPAGSIAATDVQAALVELDGDITTLDGTVTTLTSTVGTKAPLASPSFTGTVTIPTITITNDGTGSGIDADQLDGYEATAFALLTGATFTGAVSATTIQATAGAPVNQQSGTTYTLAATDAGKVVECSNASAITLTVPPNSSVAISVGAIVTVEQTGAGQVTIAQGAGVTVNNVDSHTKIKGQYGVVSLRKTATDVWTLYGATAA